jgi:3-phosphoshikimate 1-carboxyvinyltransferase
MIRYGGGRVERHMRPDGRGEVTVWPVDHLSMRELTVPGDFSSAAFFMVAALLTPGSQITIEGVGLNPTRIGLLDVLARMGADIAVEPTDMLGPEPVGRITARYSSLVACDVQGPEIPGLIDELPIFLLAAARAQGVSRVRGAGELRAKESDRLQAMGAILKNLGVSVVEHPDGMDVTGEARPWTGAHVVTQGDHRVAMVAAVAGLISEQGVTADDAGCIGVSFPGFLATLAHLGASWSGADR